MTYNAIKVEVEFRFDSPTYDNGTGALSRLYVGVAWEFALKDIIGIVEADESLSLADILRVTAEPRQVEVTCPNCGGTTDGDPAFSGHTDDCTAGVVIDKAGTLRNGVVTWAST